MKIRMLILAFVVLLAGCAHHQQKTDVLKPAQSMLWSMEKDGVKIFLLGSIHAANEDMYPLTTSLYTAYDESDTIGVEIDILNIDQAALQKLIMETGMYKEGDNIENHISPETVDKTKKALLGLELPYGPMKVYKPWMIGVAISQVKISKSGMDPSLGIDLHFLQKAVGDKKKIVELEGSEFQIGLFSGLSDKEQEDFLLSTLMSDDTTEDVLKRLRHAWKTGDLELLGNIVEESVKDFPELKDFYDKLIGKRNVNMKNTMIEFASEGGKFFFIVGAAHLVGEDGIIALMEKEGFTSKRQ
ncbi:TraB/GumN family protein [bacterium]|nr:TraB/GumN family protein [bacterium]